MRAGPAENMGRAHRMPWPLTRLGLPPQWFDTAAAMYSQRWVLTAETAWVRAEEER